jgi:hypothetical protein
MHCNVHKTRHSYDTMNTCFFRTDLHCPHDSANHSVINRVTNILIHVISCMIFYLRLFVSVFEISATVFLTVSYITSTYPILNCDLSFSQIQWIIDTNISPLLTMYVSWMKATEMGLLTLRIRRPVNMYKTLRFRRYILKNQIWLRISATR